MKQLCEYSCNDIVTVCRGMEGNSSSGESRVRVAMRHHPQIERLLPRNHFCIEILASNGTWHDTYWALSSNEDSAYTREVWASLYPVLDKCFNPGIERIARLDLIEE